MIRRGIRCFRAAAVLVAGLIVETQSPTGIGAAASVFDGKRVVAIRFDPPIQPLPLTEMLERIPLSPGDAYDGGAVREAIAGLYTTGRFIDIIVDAQELDGEVTLTFRTVNRWFTGGQSITGVKEPPTATQLLNAGRLRLGEELTEAKVRQAVDNMTSLLFKNGLFEAKVTADTQRNVETEDVTIRFDVEPGRRARFTAPIIRGQTSLTPDRVVKASGWRKWWGLGGFQPITETRVEDGVSRIRRLLLKQNFLMSGVDLAGMEWKPDLGVAVPSLDIRDGPEVKLVFEGYRLSRGKQRTLIPIFQERSVDRELLVEGAENIEAYLHSEGYFDARATFSRKQEAGAEIVRYDIDRGPRFKLTALDIEGNNYFDDGTLRERMAVLPATFLRYRNGRFSEELLARDAAAIEALYRSNGFLAVKVNTSVSAPEGEELSQVATIAVEEGPQTVTGKVEIRGIADADLVLAQSLLETAEGQPFSQEGLAQDREQVLNAFYNRGFTEATFDWLARRVDDTTVDVDIEIARGQQRFVNRVLVGGLTTTDPKLVYNRIGLRPGDPLSLGEVLASQRRLYDLGIFARVNTGIQNPNGDERSKNVLIEVEESKRYSYNLGIGAQVGRIGGGNVQNFDSPAGATGFSPRVNAGITRNNFFGVGHSGTLQGRLSNIQQRAQLTYLAPHFRDRDDLSLAVSALFDNSRDVRTFESTRIEAAIQLSQRLSRANTLQGRYILRRVSVDEASLKIRPELIPLLAQPVRLGIVGGSFIQDRRDDPIDSKQGFYNSVDFAVALGVLGSQSDFARGLGRNSSYHSLTKNLVLARAVTFGIQDRIRGGPLNEIPLPERFFAGGASSHRGFAENQAGPRDLETGFPIGGKAVMIFNHELRYPLIGDSLGAVLFHDMGNVYSNFGSLSFRYGQKDVQDFDYMVQSVGVGIRYRTPIGPIRFDLAFSPNSPRFIGFEGTREELISGGGMRTLQRINQLQFHFSLGQTF